MLRPAAIAAAALASALSGDGRSAEPDQVQFAQLTIHERVVIHIPQLSRRPAPGVWKEHGGPKCLAAATLAGALISAPKSVDLVVTGGKRYRAKLDGDCQQLDFYSGFYIRPAVDGKICADRDSIRLRSGVTCEIDGFRLLKPAD